MKLFLPFFMFLAFAPILSGENTTPSRSEEVVEVQGIQIWKRGHPTNSYATIANESLMKVTWPEAQNRIAMGVKARKGNAAIITSMIPSQRIDISQNTGNNQLDGMNVRYTIIQLKN